MDTFLQNSPVTTGIGAGGGGGTGSTAHFGTGTNCELIKKSDEWEGW